jgi:hypothetical protein
MCSVIPWYTGLLIDTPLPWRREARRSAGFIRTRSSVMVGGFEVSKKYRRTFWRKGGVLRDSMVHWPVNRHPVTMAQGSTA